MSPFTWKRGRPELGHYERSADDGKTWARASYRDANAALGYAVAETLRREPSQARPYPQSHWGCLYRWVPAVSAEAKKAG